MVYRGAAPGWHCFGAYRDCQTQLLKFHILLLTLFSPSLVPTDYPTRLLRFCISSFSPLLERKNVSASAAASKNESGGGKRGKKRARNAEDGLVGDLEGKGRQSLGAGEVDVILQALKLDKIVHPKLPPLLRAQPALRELHFFTKEGDEEKKERKLAKLGIDGEDIEVEQEEDEGAVRHAPAPAQVASTTGFASFALPAIREVSASTPAAASTPEVPIAAPVAIPSIASAHSPALVPNFTSASTSASAPAPIIAPVPSQAEQTISTTTSSSFISFTSNSASATATSKANETVVKQITQMETMEADNDDEGIPELDSGSDDDLLEDDDDDEEEE
ncbi:hypothetical protein I352_05873 [Cryptococcus deuterogattii MMRL2647]|nr:hypothetical protein I352_05873 [Cryptococcus deuterogattii MMRL2647]